VPLLHRGVETTPQLAHCLGAKEELEEYEEADEEVELDSGMAGVSGPGEKLGKKWSVGL